MRNRQFRFVFVAMFVMMLVAVLLVSLPAMTASADSTPFTTAGTYTWTVPSGVTSVTVEVWGGGGRGGSISGGSGDVAVGGGGGGAYSVKANIAVTPGNVYTVVVGAGSSSIAAGGDSYFITATTVLAKGGNSVADNSSAGATGGAATSGVGDSRYSGGNGANGSSVPKYGGGGGSSAGTAITGTNAITSTGAIAPTGGGNGGDGRLGSSGNGNGSGGSAPGGGGGGAYRAGGSNTYTGGNGAAGKVVITYKYDTTTSVTCTPNPVTYNATSSCTATVTRGGSSNTPTGTITWALSGGDSGSFSASTCALSGSGASTSCSVTYTPGAVGDGTHEITATYGGNTNFNGSNGSQNVTVNKANQTITVTTPAPASAVFGASFTVSATASSGLPVAFSASGVCTNVGPTFTMTGGTGTCTVQYDQTGNADYDAAPQVTETVTAQLATQTIVVTTPAPPSAVFGASFTVSATASSGLPVAFSASGVCTNVGPTFTMTGGTGTCTVQYDQTGNADYSAAPQVTEAVTAQKANTTTTLVSSANPSVVGSNVTFTATVAPSSGTGDVQFYADGAALGGPAPLSGGAAGYSTTSLAVGTHVITATYSGDVNYTGSTGRLLPDQVVSAACTTVSGVDFNFAPAVPKVGQSVNFTATATGGTAPITYTWNFGHGTPEVTTATAIVHSFPLTTTVKTYNVTLAAENACTTSPVSAAKQVTVWPNLIYLPLIRR